MGEAKIEAAPGQETQGLQQIVITLLGHQSADGEYPVGRERGGMGSKLEEFEFNAVVNGVDGRGIRLAVQQSPKVAGIVFRAGDNEFCPVDFSGELFGLGSVDVLGVGGEAEGQAGEFGGEIGHGRRSMAEMGVQVLHGRVQELCRRQVPGLEKMAHRGSLFPFACPQDRPGEALHVMLPETLPEQAIAFQEPSPVGQNVFGHIAYGGLDFLHVLVAEVLPRLPQGKDPDGDAERFQEQNFSADESF